MYIKHGEEKLFISCDNGFLKTVEDKQNTLSIVIQRDYGGNSNIVIRTKKRIVACNLGIIYEDDENKYVVELPAKQGDFNLVLTFSDIK